MHLHLPDFLRRRNKDPLVSPLPPVDRLKKVDDELGQAEDCIRNLDNQCTIEHLKEAKRHEDCPMCQRRIETFKTQVDGLSPKDQLRKVQLIRRFVNPSAEIHQLVVESDSIKPRGGIYALGRAMKRIIIPRKK